jgi:hypothetical protein
MILKPLFSEILCPRQLSDLTLPQQDIDKLEQMVASRAIMNLLFYGKTGSGKTSAARVILSILAPRSSVEIDGSLLTGAAFPMTRIGYGRLSAPTIQTFGASRTRIWNLLPRRLLLRHATVQVKVLRLLSNGLVLLGQGRPNTSRI